MRTLALLMVLSGCAAAQSKDWYEKAVKSLEATIDPATARPGQTVTFKVTLELNDGYHTYPTVQVDEKASTMINTLTFPKPGTLVFVGSPKDPEKPEVKAEPLIGIKELHTYKGKVTWEQIAVVSPKAAAGEATIAMEAFKIQVCDEESCFPPKTLKPSAKLTVKGDVMAVEKAYAAEVEKALKK